MGHDVARMELLAGGAANDVWSVRVNGHLAVSDQERMFDSELHRFVRLDWEIVTSLAWASGAPLP